MWVNVTYAPAPFGVEPQTASWRRYDRGSTDPDRDDSAPVSGALFSGFRNVFARNG
jgi:hypothetical protein